jgi:aspartate aminotransferase, mitochondrial
VLPSVRTAEEKVVSSKPDKEYAGITGVPAFTKAAAILAYGPDSAPIKEDRVAITQSISGTGALRIGGAFLERFYPHGKKIYIPNPSWANHNAVFKDSGLQVAKYRYYNQETIGLDFDGMIEDLKAAPNNSIVLLHACAHNPTGIDPTEEQWRKIADVVKEKEHYPFFDMAYQGFASGDTNKDAFAVRHFIKDGHGIVLAQSFAKNMVSPILSHSLTFLHHADITSPPDRVYTASASAPSPSYASQPRRRSGWIPRSRSWSDRCTRTHPSTVRAWRRPSSTTPP